MKTYAIGGFGCGNLGDDAIFQAMKLEYPDLIQIYVNKPYGESDYVRYRYWDLNVPSVTSLPYIWYSDLIDHGFPEDATDGELILGGGGIFHGKETVNDLLKVSKQAELKRMKISVRKVGMEYLTSEFEDLTKKVLEKAYFISVRSSKSAEIVHKLGFKCELENDYAFLLGDKFFIEDVEFPKFEEKRPLIGIVTAGNGDLSKITLLGKILTIGEWGNSICNLIHIPHSKHYTDWKTNDVVGGEILWSGIEVYHGKRWTRFKQLPFPETVYKLLNAYTKVDGIIGMRYHSFIFSELKNIPLLAIASGKKAEGYFLDNKGERTISVSSDCSQEDLKNGLNEFLKVINVR